MYFYYIRASSHIYEYEYIFDCFLVYQTNDDERLYVMFCDFVGTAVFAFTVGTHTDQASLIYTLLDT